MRGAHKQVTRTQGKRGIIPADAGSTRYADPREHPRWDHPRGCGEHPILLMLVAGLIESSPRMRGAPGCRPCLTMNYRIIPADAGNT